jgi:hypothetical protein
MSPDYNISLFTDYESDKVYESCGNMFRNRRLWVSNRREDGFYYTNDGLVNDGYGYIDPAGNEVILTRYRKVSPFSDGCAAVQGNDNMWTLIDTSGQRVSVYEYDDVGITDFHWIVSWYDPNIDEESVCFQCPNFSYGLLPVKRGGKWGLVSTDAREVTPIVYDRVGYPLVCGFSEGLLPVQRDGKWGFIDTLGYEAIIPQFDNIGDDRFSEGLLPVRRSGFWGYINTAGQMVIDSLHYDEVAAFHNGYAAVAVYDTSMVAILDALKGRNEYDYSALVKKWGYINRSGRLVIPCRYSSRYNFGNYEVGFVHAEIDEFTGYRRFYVDVDAEGNEYEDEERGR